MVESIIIEYLKFLPWLSQYIPVLSFLAPIIGGGELGVIAVAFLFVNNLSSFVIVLIFSFLGMMTIDSIWFCISKSKLLIKLKRWKRISKQYGNVEKNIEKLSHGEDIIIISLAKVLIGTRILLILYLGARKISFLRFFAYNTAPTFIWAVILSSIGFLAASGFSSIILIFRNIQLGITFLIVFFVVIYLIQKWINQRLIKGQEI